MWKIAIIDDDRKVLKGMKQLIPWEELNAEWAGEGANGRLGLELIRKVQPDIVVTDIYMPSMNGLEMIEKARGEQYKGKMIIHSAYSDFEYARQALRLQVDDYLSKPISLHTLRSTLTKAIGELEEKRKKEVEQDVLHQKLMLYEPFAAKEWVKCSVTETKHKQTIDYMIRYVHEHYAEDITLCDLAEKVFISRNYLSDIFKKATGETFNGYLTRVRMEKAKLLIQEGRMHIYEIARKVGYQNVPYFSTIFKKYAGVNPTELVKQQ